MNREKHQAFIGDLGREVIAKTSKNSVLSIVAFNKVVCLNILHHYVRGNSENSTYRND